MRQEEGTTEGQLTLATKRKETSRVVGAASWARVAHGPFVFPWKGWYDCGLQYSQWPGGPWGPGEPRPPWGPGWPGDPRSPMRPGSPTPCGPGGPAGETR